MSGEKKVIGDCRGGGMYKGGGMAPQNFEIFLIYIIILMFSNFSLQK